MRGLKASLTRVAGRRTKRLNFRAQEGTTYSFQIDGYYSWGGVSLALSMEVWRMVQRSSHRFWQSFLLPGLVLQRVTTREPRLDETRVALAAVASVLRRELAA